MTTALVPADPTTLPDEDFPCACGLLIPFRDDEEYEAPTGLFHSRSRCHRP
jgi:hypothetical protein